MVGGGYKEPYIQQYLLKMIVTYQVKGNITNKFSGAQKAAPDDLGVHGGFAAMNPGAGQHRDSVSHRCSHNLFND